MKFEAKSIFFRFLFLLISFSIITLSLIFFSTQKIIKEIESEHLQLVAEKHSFEIKKKLEKAITELSISQLLHNPHVLEIKKIDITKDIKSYWDKHNIEGFIIEEVETNKPKITFSHLKTIDMNKVKLDSFKEGINIIEIQGKKMLYLTIDFPAWHWTVITLTKKDDISKAHQTINYISFALLIAMVVTILLLAYILNSTIVSPITVIVRSIKRQQEIKPIGITEIDTITNTVNEALKNLIQKNKHLQMMYKALLDIHKLHNIDDICGLATRIGREIFNTQLSMIIIHNKENSDFKYYVSKDERITNYEMENISKSLNELIQIFTEPFYSNDKKQIEELIKSPTPPYITNISIYPIMRNYKGREAFFICLNRAEDYDEYSKSLMGIFIANISSAFERSGYIDELIRFQNIIDSAFDMIVITDENGLVTYVNKSFETFTGYSSKEIIGRNINILKSQYNDKEFYEELLETIKYKKVWKGELTDTKKNGEVFFTSTVIFPVYFSDKINYVSIKRDITEEKKLYQQLLLSQRMEAMGVLASGLAHDFNNVLTSILGYSEIMLNSLTETDKFYKYIKIINESAKKAGELTKNLLSITRKDRIEKKPVDINQIVKEVVDIISHSIPKQIEIVINLSEDIPLTMAEPTQIHQVILNLALNARDAMPDGGLLKIQTNIAKRTDTLIDSNNEEYIMITVSDTGLGIDNSIQEKIFDPFFTTKGKGKGTGLGLYMVHSIITNHDGFVSLHSQPNQGTIFNIYLPIKNPPKITTREEITNLEGSANVLIIDDEQDVRNITKDMLENLGYSVITAKDGIEGINTYIENKNNIDVVILDMIMPKKNGDEVFFELKKINPKVKIVICSGFSHDNLANIADLLKAGAVGFIQKPFTVNTLLSYIKKAISDDN